MNLNNALSIKIGTTEAIDVRLGSVSVWSSSLWTFDNPTNGSAVSLTAEFSGSNTVDWGDSTKYNLVSGTTISHTYLSGASAPTYILSGSSTITESGSANTYTVDTTNVSDTTLLYWSINGDTSDFTETSGDITITSNTGTFDITAIADTTTEGNEPYTISLHTDSATGLIVDSLSIVVSDTSTTPATPTFSLVNDVEGFAEEGDVVEFTLATNQTGPFDYTLIGSESNTSLTVDDFEAGVGLTTSLTGTFAGNGSTVRYKLKEDNLTEGILTMIASITDTNGDGIAEATSTVFIGDTSTAPASPTYDITPRADNVDEGSSLTFDIVTTNVANGTLLHYTILGNTGDFSDIAGNFSIQNNAGVVVVTPTADETTESAAETFRVQTRTGGTSGPVVDTTDEITINDTSQTPAFSPDYTLSVSFGGTGYYALSGSDANGAVSGNNPALVFSVGDKVRFNNSVSGAHPLYIKTQQGSGTGNQASGVSGAGSATVDWTIPSAGTYYYQCSVHNNMYGEITVT